jgi:lysophospholipase L1-like esterase
MWGPWVRDDYTIASSLSRALYEKGYTDFHITNFGESGYVSTQEVIQLLLELKRGRRPQIVIFYDGVNDVFSAFQNKVPGIPLNENNRRKEFNCEQESNVIEWLARHSAVAGGLSSLNRKFRQSLQSLSNPWSSAEDTTSSFETSTGSLANETVLNYLANIRVVCALSREYNFEPFFFWQPTVFSKDVVSSYEMEIRQSFPEDLAAFYVSAYSEITSHVSTERHFYNLQKVFGYRHETIFLDYCHTTEQGNQMIAAAIAQHLVDNSFVFDLERKSR